MENMTSRVPGIQAILSPFSVKTTAEAIFAASNPV
jgi:hypothetical protein